MISEKMWQPHRHVLAHMPVNVVALEVLGCLAEKFPSWANTLIVRFLCRFLLDPCPMLVKLASEGVPELKRGVLPQTQQHVDRREEEQASKKRVGLNSLRTATIDSLVRWA